MTLKAKQAAKIPGRHSAESIGMPIVRKRAISRDLTADEAEVARVMKICNTCRYCEGFCAVFPSMTRHIDFGKADVHHLANLCHNCSACLKACYYAPPDPLGVNVPQAMARVRLQTYTDYAWPAPLGALYRRNGLTVSVALAAGLALFLLLAIAQVGTMSSAGEGSFYAVFPHHLMVAMLAPVFLFAVFALGTGVRRFWRDAKAGPASGAAVAEAAHDVLRLKNLDGGQGEGCDDPDDVFTKARRTFHHLTFYGFLACFSATAVATLYHYALDWPAPYSMISLPKLLGISGGLAIVIGTGGLFALNLRRPLLQQDPAQQPMDRGFILLLMLVAASGLGLMLAKHSSALTLALCLHLGSVMALFATLPYGKFAHGIYRSAALLKWSVERRQPKSVWIAGD